MKAKAGQWMGLGWARWEPRALRCLGFRPPSTVAEPTDAHLFLQRLFKGQAAGEGLREGGGGGGGCASAATVR